MWRYPGALLEPPNQRSGRQPTCLGQFRDGYAIEYPFTHHLRDEALLPWRERTFDDVTGDRRSAVIQRQVSAQAL